MDSTNIIVHSIIERRHRGHGVESDYWARGGEASKLPRAGGLNRGGRVSGAYYAG